MFTGIVEETGRVVKCDEGMLEILSNKVLEHSMIGDSIAVNGTCLTVTKIDSDRFFTNITPETVSRTNLGFLKIGGLVNLERPLTYGGRLAGHLVQGHVDSTVILSRIEPSGNSMLMRFDVSPTVIKYIVEKGFVALDGVSLTITEVYDTSFEVSMIPYTLEFTTFKTRQIGDSVNIEVDILAKYVEKMIKI